MSPIQSTELKDQTYISVTAWLVIMLTGVIFYFTAFNLVKIHMIAEVQVEVLSDAIANPLEGMGDVQEKIKVFYYTVCAFCIIGLIAGIGILRRRALGKLIFTVLSIVAVIGIVFMAIYIRFYIHDKYFEQPANVDFSSMFNKMLRLNMAVYGVFAVVVARTLFRAVLKLNSKAYKLYFE